MFGDVYIEIAGYPLSLGLDLVLGLIAWVGLTFRSRAHWLRVLSGKSPADGLR